MASFHFNREDSDDSDISLNQSSEPRANSPFAPKPKVAEQKASTGLPVNKPAGLPTQAPASAKTPGEGNSLPFTKPATSSGIPSVPPKAVQKPAPTPIPEEDFTYEDVTPTSTPQQENPLTFSYPESAEYAPQEPVYTPVPQPQQIPATDFQQQPQVAPVYQQPQSVPVESELVSPVQVNPQLAGGAAYGQPNAQPNTQFIAPTTINPAYATQEEQPKGKGKRSKGAKEKKQGSGFWSAKPKEKKERKPSDYDGKRNQVLWVRLGVGGVILLLAFGGVRSAFFPDSGPTPNQVSNVAKEAVNYTGFPTQSGAVFAQQFVQQFMTYSSNESNEDREARLKDYVSDTLLQQIDITPLGAANSDTSVDNSSDGPKVDQTVTGGPMVVASKNLSASQAVFTVKFQINKESDWIYLNVPVKFTEKNNQMTVAGPPSFTKPNQNVGKTTPEEYTASFESTDSELEKSLNSDFKSYMQAWGASNSTIISRYTAESATQDAQAGLQGAVTFYSLDDLNIEGYSKDNPSTATVRRVELQVTWEDPKTQLLYTQEYRVLLQLSAAKQWTIYDIQNFSVLN